MLSRTLMKGGINLRLSLQTNITTLGRIPTKSPDQNMLMNSPLRQFSIQKREQQKIYVPKYKLHFINHPRYGLVYPFVSYDLSKTYTTLPLITTLGHALLNVVFLYGTFIQTVFTPVAASFLSNPLFLLPSLYLNQAMASKYYIFFYGGRSHCQNMFLKPDGKSVIIETRDGDSKEVANDRFYTPKVHKSKYETRLDVFHGANVYLFLRGNAHVYDQDVLEAVLDQNFIDVNNVEYNYDVSSDFTWNYRELVQIKLRNRMVSRFYKPIGKVIKANASALKWDRAKHTKSTINRSKVLKDYNLYRFFPGAETTSTGAALPGPDGKLRDDDEHITVQMVEQSQIQHEANVSNGGKIEDKSQRNNRQGRRVKPYLNGLREAAV